MSFFYPEFFWLFLLLIPVILIGLRRFVLGERLLSLVGIKKKTDLIRIILGVKVFLLVLTFSLALILIVIALAEPVWGEEPVTKETSGLDICFVIDISRSMLAADVEPSRLEKAVDAAHILLQTFGGSRFSLVALKGSGIVLVPFTEDPHVMESFLSNLHPGILTVPGTDLESGLNEAIRTFPENSGRNRVIIFISDGETLSGNLKKAVRSAVDQDIKIYTLGIGTEAGAMIPVGDKKNLMNSKGKPVITRLDPEPLTVMAEQTGGRYYSMEDPGSIMALGQNIAELDQLNRSRGILFQKVRRYRLFLLPAIILLFINLIIRNIKWRKTL